MNKTICSNTYFSRLQGGSSRVKGDTFADEGKGLLILGCPALVVTAIVQCEFQTGAFHETCSHLKKLGGLIGSMGD